MTTQILSWLHEFIRPRRLGHVFEVGSLNVNGSPRDVLRKRALSWVGCDRVSGPCVDEVGGAADVIGGRTFDTVIACECYEHDPRFWVTHAAVVASLRPGGLYVVTSPTIGFPFHDYGGDFYRFTEMAMRDVFMEGFDVLDVTTVGESPGLCVCGAGVKRGRRFF